MIDDLDDEVKTYLSAVGAVAIYVATVEGMPVRIGFSHDPRKTRTFLGQRWPRVAIAWLAWIDENAPGAPELCATIVEQQSTIAGIRQPLSVVLTKIEALAYLHKVTLTPNARAIERARACSERLDRALMTLQANGQLGAFNHAYRVYREGQRARGESAMPYWAVRQDLRRVVIRYLAAHSEVDPSVLLDEIRERFPWFHSNRPLVSPYRKYQGT